jgi:ubiquitin C-terminal hydrolase
MTSIHPITKKTDSEMITDATSTSTVATSTVVTSTVATSPRRGLANIGNTCYLNSAFQALRYSKPFAAYFGSDAWRAHSHPDRNGYALAEETSVVLRALADTTITARMVAPSKFVREFVRFAGEINDDIRFGAQADAAEAIQILLDGLHTQQAREVSMKIRGEPKTPEAAEYIKSLESWASFYHKEYSPIAENFYGQTRTRIVCACGESSARYEPWGVFKAPIPGAEKAGAPAPTLQACIAAALEAETLDDYTCDKCNKKGSSRMSRTISRFPNQMVLCLKRFTNMGAKVRARIPYDPDIVDLSEWLAWPTLQPARDARYRVYATVEHMGSSRFGHYVMRARESDTWLVYDDGNCSVSSIGGAAGPDTYILFLERI